MTEIELYGASWCPDCRRAKKFLADQRVPYVWHDIEQRPELVEIVEAKNEGKRTIPTIVFPDGSHLAEPSNEELADKLGITRVADMHIYDLVIVGGGPTGLTTSIYAARENLDTLVIDSKGLGGQAGVTERLDNYPGFPEGIAGAELADRFVKQAERYGVEMLQAVSVTHITDEGHRELDVETATGDHYHARAVLIATGSSYRRTDAEGEEDLIGAGHPLLRDVRRAVLQGRRGAARDRRREQRSRGGPLPHAVLRQGDGRRVRRPAARLEDPAGQGDEPPEDGDPAEARREVVRRQGRRQRQARHGHDRGPGLGRARSSAIRRASSSSWGSTRTPASWRGRSASTSGSSSTTDATFMTDLPGVFAAGDVRGGSTKQLASAVGEGAAVAIQIRGYLDRVEREEAV